MFLQLEDQQQIFVPGEKNPGYMVDFSFFDRLNDYEFSQTIAELLAFNSGFNLNNAIRQRNIRRAAIGLPATNYSPMLESKFGDWIKRTGKKIEGWFKPSESNQTATVTMPDGQQVQVNTPVKKDSGFMQVLTGVAKAFGLYTEQPTYVQPEKSTFEKILPFAAIGIGGLVLWKVIKK